MTRHGHAPYSAGEDSTPATMGRRLSAGLLDLVLVLVLGGAVLVLGLVRGSDALVLVGSAAVLVVSVVQWVAHGRSGWTVGRRAVGIRTLDVESRTPIGLLRVLVRTAVIAAGVLAFGVGLLVVLASPAFDRTGRRRGWQDLAARDEVLDVRAVRVPVVAPPRVRRCRARAAARGTPTGQRPRLGRRRAGDGHGGDGAARPPASTRRGRPRWSSRRSRRSAADPTWTPARPPSCVRSGSATGSPPSWR